MLRDRVMRPIGVADEDWSVGYGKTFQVDGLPVVAGWGGGSQARAAGSGADTCDAGWCARFPVLRKWRKQRHGTAFAPPALNQGALSDSIGTSGIPSKSASFFWTSMIASARSRRRLSCAFSRCTPANSAVSGLGSLCLGPRLTGVRHQGSRLHVGDATHSVRKSKAHGDARSRRLHLCRQPGQPP